MLNTTDPSLAFVVPYAQIKPQMEDSGVRAKNRGPTAAPRQTALTPAEIPLLFCPKTARGRRIRFRLLPEAAETQVLFPLSTLTGRLPTNSSNFFLMSGSTTSTAESGSSSVP